MNKKTKVMLCLLIITTFITGCAKQEAPLVETEQDISYQSTEVNPIESLVLNKDDVPPGWDLVYSEKTAEEDALVTDIEWGWKGEYIVEFEDDAGDYLYNLVIIYSDGGAQESLEASKFTEPELISDWDLEIVYEALPKLDIGDDNFFYKETTTFFEDNSTEEGYCIDFIMGEIYESVCSPNQAMLVMLSKKLEAKISS
ncbi:hypothetical protein ACFL6I_22515 [candidate division KSB1 bacterium]